MSNKQVEELQASRISMSPHDLAALGGGKIAYVRAMRGEELGRLFPQAPVMQPNQQIYVLIAADGSPLVIADSEQAAVANAWHNDLVTVSLH
jgi:hypothetical protein